MVFGLFCKSPPKAAPSALYDAFKPLKVLNTKGETISFGDVLPKGKPTLVWLMRRFGCPLCRAYAVKLDKIKPQLEAKGVHMVAVGLEQIGLEEFQEGKFWSSDLVIETPDQELHKLLNTKRASALSLLNINMFREGMKLQKEVGGNATVGDGMILGGVWMMDASGKCTFEFGQKHFRDHADIDKILHEANKM